MHNIPAWYPITSELLGTNLRAYRNCSDYLM